MYRNPLITAACGAALLALGACNNEPEPLTINQYDPQADDLAKATPKQLPPAITANRTYRCSDNSLFYVDFYNNNTALIRTSRDGMPTPLTSPDGAAPYAGEGYTVSGSGTNTSINGKSCHT